MQVGRLTGPQTHTEVGPSLLEVLAAARIAPALNTWVAAVGSAMAIAESLAPLDGKTVLIVGAAGGVGSFLTQFAADAGAHVDASAAADQAGRMKGYGAAETVDRAHPDGIDVLIDLASDARQFAALARQVRPGGTAITTRYVADREALAAAGVAGVNFRLRMTVSLLDRLAAAVVAGIIVPPPTTRFSLDEVPALLSKHGRGEGKTVITM